MFIIWGTRRTERKLGFVADFCPICREIRAFRLVRIGLASHIYYISFGMGKLVDHHIRCHECGLALSVDPLRYAVIEKDPFALERLIEVTFPQLKEIHAERLALESQIKKTPSLLTPEERANLFIEPFRLLNPLLEQRFQESTKFDKQSGIGCLGTILISAVLFILAGNVRTPMQDKIALMAVIFLCIGTAYTFVQLHFGPGRFLKEKIVPPLAQALDPLEPTQEEISRCLEKCKAAQMRIGQKLNLQTLWAELERRAAPYET